ncbi:hypothetical protein C2857_003628 [Epichloe festucae Fl1]|uniref:Uncharacterized protein n=1 Tax=Epichloe festucae (strain Fl1) TaxID=877507 RepID=A0A7S9KNW7_EPIFF|nr:hypothetical protein C2857_003628 [Epichloe festucae Fl1]
MKLLLPLLSLSAIASSLPTWHQGPVISDDDTLMERRLAYKVEMVRARSSRFTFPDTIVTKVTKYASGAQGYLAESFKGAGAVAVAVADSNGQVLTTSFGNKKGPFTMGHASREGHGHRHHRHRISLLGFRNRLAIFILTFAVVLAFACSHLRR